MNRRPTIVDVARHAGVSKSTVSLVLHHSPLVRPATRSEVEKSMAALGYVYNRAAANLRGAGAGLIGLVINDLRNPFFTEFAASAQMAFASRGFATVIANTDEDPALQAQVIASMIEHGVSAFLVSPAYGDQAAIFDRIERAGIPTLQVLRLLDERTDVFPFASLDYATGGRLAARHLIELGARRIAFVGGLENRPVTRERMGGYLEAMGEAGLAPVRAARPAVPRVRPRHRARARPRPAPGRRRGLLQRPRRARHARGLRRGGRPGRRRLPAGRLRRHRGMRARLAAAELGPLRRRPLRAGGRRRHAGVDRDRTAPPGGPPGAGAAHPPPLEPGRLLNARSLDAAGART